jgi:hypothetical protein
MASIEKKKKKKRGRAENKTVINKTNKNNKLIN